MKNCILHVLCEGPTEEQFVNKILAPYLRDFYVYAKPITLCTSRKKSAFGGVISYQQVKNDLNRIFSGVHKSVNETHIVTTMLDLYALPTDFPRAYETDRYTDAYSRVTDIEQAFANDIAHHLFIPYIQLHEFEALLFADISKLAYEYPNARREILQLKEETDRIGNPELINHGVNTAPSKRIIKSLANKYNYSKVRSGAGIAALITLPVIMNHCTHFNNWIMRIIAFSEELN